MRTRSSCQRWFALVAVALTTALSVAVPVANAQAVRRAPFDFTGDGTSDLLFRQGSSLGFWDFDAGGVRPVFLGLVDAPWSIVGVGDYNGDRTSDIMFREAATGAIGYWSIVAGQMSAFVPLAWTVGADWQVVSSRKRSDFNGDGRDDLLWRRSDGEVGIYLLRSGAPFDFDWVSLGAVDPAWSVTATGDFDGDDRDDILWQNTAGTVGYWRMDTSPQAWVPLIEALDSIYWRVETVADVDGDGDDDIYWRRPFPTTIEGYWRMEAGVIAAFVPTTMAFDSFNRGLSFASGDYYGRGHEDLAAAHLGIGPPGPPGPRTVYVFDFVGGIATTRRAIGSELFWTLQ